MVYPWETQNLAIVSDLLYNLAHNSGYNGTREEFYSNFGSYLTNNNQKIIFKTYPEFPQIGQQDMLYFDLNEKILYYWDNGYIPVNAMLIANTIVNGGEA